MQCEVTEVPPEYDFLPDCSNVKPVHDSPSMASYCQARCENVIKECEASAQKQGLSIMQCFVSEITGGQAFTGKCQLSNSVSSSKAA